MEKLGLQFCIQLRIEHRVRNIGSGFLYERVAQFSRNSECGDLHSRNLCCLQKHLEEPIQENLLEILLECFTIAIDLSLHIRRRHFRRPIQQHAY
jgi:hypothetical protein